jgi:hypothetical protein
MAVDYNEPSMLDQLQLPAPAPLSIAALLLNLLIGIVLAAALSWAFARFGRTYSSRAAIAWVLPVIVLSTILIISVVKSSLALSLGLVGALSIVRFRTPIKEPEELAYLFLAIAVGLGLGADQRVPTLVAFGVILAVVVGRSMLLRPGRAQNLYLNVEVPAGGDHGVLRRMNDMLTKSVKAADMRRIDVRDGVHHATYYIDCDDPNQVIGLTERLAAAFPGAGISFVEQRGIVDQ